MIESPDMGTVGQPYAFRYRNSAKIKPREKDDGGREIFIDQGSWKETAMRVVEKRDTKEIV